jgi:hypothetical protein
MQGDATQQTSPCNCRKQHTPNTPHLINVGSNSADSPRKSDTARIELQKGSAFVVLMVVLMVTKKGHGSHRVAER